MRIVILAGHAAQAMRYAQEQGLQRMDYIILHSREQLMGLENFMLVCCGTWSKRKDVEMLLQYAQTRRGVTIKFV